MATSAPPVEMPAAACMLIKKPAKCYKTLSGFSHFDDKLFHNKIMHQMGPGQEDDKGNDVGGCYVVSDGGEVMLCQTSEQAKAWARNKLYVNDVLAPSLAYVDVCGEKIAVVNEADLVKLILYYPKMKPISDEAALAQPRGESVHTPSSVSRLFGNKRFGHIAASRLKTVTMFRGTEASRLEGKILRRVLEGQIERAGKDASGLYVILDFPLALWYTSEDSAIDWVNRLDKVHTDACQSFTYMKAEGDNVSSYKLTWMHHHIECYSHMKSTEIICVLSCSVAISLWQKL